MKKRQNLIKTTQIQFKTNLIELSSKKSYKHFFRRKIHRVKNIFALLRLTHTFKIFIKVCKSAKNNNLKIKNNLNISKSLHINYIGDGLKFKYNELTLQDFSSIKVLSINYLKSKVLYSTEENINIFNIEMFLTYVHNIYICNHKYDVLKYDYFNLCNTISYTYFLEIKKTILIILLKR